MVYDSELYHYGVLGMKWGVRRYQNYDGTYTKKGLQRLAESEGKYNDKVAKYRETRTAYKSGIASKDVVKTAKAEVKKAKRQMEKSYNQLKTDKLADEGKELYKKGHTIRDNRAAISRVRLGTAVASVVADMALRNSGYNFVTAFGSLPLADVVAGSIGAGGIAYTIGMTMKDNRESKRLRAYYAH